MEEWLLHRFASSTFNTCPNGPLPCMTGPPVEIHLEDGVIPSTVHTAAPVPIHWQEQVLSDLKRDEALGVIERISYGEPVSWCHRMVVTRKHNGTPRRTVDLSSLNKHCKREPYPTESPFHLARGVPKALGRQSVMPGTAIVASPSVNLTVTSQSSSLSSDDGDTRGRLKASCPLVTATTAASNVDAILSDFELKERCVDNTIQYETDLLTHSLRTIDFLIRVGQAGIVLNADQFYFARRMVDFAKFLENCVQLIFSLKRLHVEKITLIEILLTK